MPSNRVQSPTQQGTVGDPTGYSASLTIAAKVPVTEAEGPGKRFAVWVQGCPFRCPGCCNPQYLAFDREPSAMLSPRALAKEILSYRDQIEGVTFVGGEPFSQAKGLAEVARDVQQAGLSVMVFSGFSLEELRDSGDPDFASRAALLDATDLLVDGPYRRDRPVTDRRWIGSANQEIHFLTDRYLELKNHWPREADTIEIRYKNGGITINGFPHPDITRKSVEALKK